MSEEKMLEKARDRALTLWRLRGSSDEFPVYLQLCCEIEEFRADNERMEMMLAQIENFDPQLYDAVLKNFPKS